MNEYCGMSAAQQMRRCGLTIASLPLDSKARICERTADLKDGGLRYACYSSAIFEREVQLAPAVDFPGQGVPAELIVLRFLFTGAFDL